MRVIYNNDIVYDPKVITEDLWNPLDYVPKARKARKSRPELPTLELERERALPKYIKQCTKPNTDNDIVVGREVGDDRVDVSQSYTALAMQLSLQSSIMKMKTSEEDTFISKDLWNFCETTSYLPSHVRSSFESARKTGKMAHMSFVDVPPLRIVIDTTKSDMGHSSTAVGKSAMMGNRLRSVNPANQLCMDTASWLQDSTLNVKKSSEPKYMPRIIGGSNAPPLFGVASNTYLSLRAYRGGTYSRVYGTAINELKNCLDDYEVTGVQGSAMIASRLRQKQEYLHGTYGEHVLIPQLAPLEAYDGEVLRPVYTAAPGINLFCSVEQRLLAAKRLTTRRGALSEQAKISKLKNVLFGMETPEFARIRENQHSRDSRLEYEGALSANSAFQRLLARKANGSEVDELQKNDFFRCSYGVQDLTSNLVHWVVTGGGEALTINDLYLPEEMYLTEEVTSDSYFKVPGISVVPIFNHKPMKEVVTVAKSGLWQISETMEEWADNTARFLRNERDLRGPLKFDRLAEIYNYNREWVADDTGIIADILNRTSMRSRTVVFLVSHDLRLGQQASVTTNNWVVLIKPAELIRSGWQPSFPFPEISVDEVKSLMIATTMLPPGEPLSHVFIDTGALQSACENMETLDDHGSTCYQIVVPPTDRTLGTVRVDANRLIRPTNASARVRPIVYQPPRSRAGRPDRVSLQMTNDL